VKDGRGEVHLRPLQVNKLGSPQPMSERNQNHGRVPPADDPRQRQPDIAKARHVLGWTPKTPLKEGLVRTIAYFEALLQEDGVRAVVGIEK